MFRQIQLFFTSPPQEDLWSDLSVKVHGYLMSRIRPQTAELFHRSGVQPFSICTVADGEGGIIRVSTFADEADELYDACLRMDHVRVFGGQNLTIEGKTEAPAITLSDIPRFIRGDRVTLRVITPAHYRSEGRLHYGPDLSRYFYSVAQKLRKYCDCPLQHDDVDAAFAGREPESFNLSDACFTTGHHPMRGLVGETVWRLSDEPDLAEQTFRLLLGVSTYTGIGAQTTQGMGGTVIQ